MEALLTIIGLLVVIWYLGFVASARKLAVVANRQVSVLELNQAKNLKNQFSETELGELDDYLTKFDGRHTA
jgi:hypothetical protein